MKKNIFKSSLILSSICALFSLCLIVKPNKVEKVSAISTSIPDLETYTPYEIYDGSFYFDWSFVTFDVNSSDDNSSVNRSVSRSVNRPLAKPMSLYSGLIWIADDTRYSFANIYMHNFNVEFYSYIVTYGTNVNFQLFDHFNFGTGNIIYSRNGSSYAVYDRVSNSGWENPSCRVCLFLGSGTAADVTSSLLIDWLYDNGNFYKFGDLCDMPDLILSYESAVAHLSQEVSSLEGEISSLESEITDLEEQIEDLLDGVVNLQSALSVNTSVTRQNTYIVDVSSELNYEFQIFVNVDYQTNQDFYVKPIKISCNSKIEVFDVSSRLVDYYNNVVDVLDFSEVDVYYYNYSDLYNYLYVDIGDDWLLNIPYVDNEDVSTFSLTNINYYISDWLLDYKSDLSYSDFAYSRRTFVNYNNLISGALGGTNMAYLDGYYAGIDEGYLQGKQDGYAQGVGDGFAAGSNQDATVATIFSGILQIAMVPVNFFLGIFNFEILGINMASFVSALLTVAITIIIIRVVTGKKND